MGILGGILIVIVVLLLIVIFLTAALQPSRKSRDEGIYTANGFLPKGGSLQKRPPR